MNAARKGSGPAKPRVKKPAPEQPQAPAPVVCRRCGSPGPVDEDGFCEKCEKALEQAFL